STAFFSVDVSFISLHHPCAVSRAVTTTDAVGVCLFKPQFEAGRERVGKNGVVRDPTTHREVLLRAMGYAVYNGFGVRGLNFSPVKGRSEERRVGKEGGARRGGGQKNRTGGEK